MGMTHVFLVLTIGAVTCYPINDLNAEDKPELKDELHFPNGTVVGKYTYMDNDGNPVEVKYYAGDSSYGVELKSVKVVDTNTEEPWMSDKYEMKEPTYKDVSNILNFNPVIANKYKIDPYNLDKEYGKLNHYKVDKTSPGYEIFYKNELKSPKQCSKDKVMVYLDKNENRKVRNTLNNVDTSKYCEQY